MDTDHTTFTLDGLTAHFQSARAGYNAQLGSRLAEFIDATQETLDCAIYDLRDPDVLAALKRLADAGKSLRIVYDASGDQFGDQSVDPKPSGTEAALSEAGLRDYATPVRRDKHLMHDKFLVRDASGDGAAIWTGSANFTVGGLEKQDNTCLAIASSALAARYGAVFATLLAAGQPRPGPDAEAQTAAMEDAGELDGGAASALADDAPSDASTSIATESDARSIEAPADLQGPIAVGGIAVTPAFAPAEGEDIENAVVAALRGARKVRVMAFLISDPGILGALATFGADPNFDIRGVYDPNGMNDVLQYTRLDASNFWFTRDARFERAPSHPFNPHGEQDFMHNKTLVIDDHLVVTGSYNFSENAEGNDENLLVIDSAGLAAAYTTYFDALFETYGQQPEVPVAAAVVVEHPGPRPHVLIADPEGRAARADLWLARSHDSFKTETERGRTDDLVVYSDGTEAGDAAADAVLATAGDDVAAVRAWFGGLTLPAGREGKDPETPRTAPPPHVLIDPEAGGAYHFGCAATDLYIEPNAETASGLMVAELVEVYEAALANGWECGRTNGEALSRVLAAERNPNLAPLLAATEQRWWAEGQMDHISSNHADDHDQAANGCGTLFLYYLHTQLGHSWERIIAAGGATLAECYQALTGNPASQAFADFLTLLVTSNFAGDLTVPASGNPFPLRGMSLFEPVAEPAAPPVPAVPHVPAPLPFPTAPARPPIPGPPVDGTGTVH